MSAEMELAKLSELGDFNQNSQHVRQMINDVDEQIKHNLVTQFGIAKFFDTFKDGGGVDTIHNVRNGVYSSDAVKRDLEAATSGYDKDVARKLHGGSEKYKEINRQQTELKKNNQLIDVNTGKLLRRNQQTDLDHTVATKTIWEDQGRALAGLSADELANTESNLHLTDKSINRSMGAQDKTDYANDLSRKRSIWKKQNELDQNDPNLSQEKKRAKAENLSNRLSADEQAIKANDRQAKRVIKTRINQYYQSPNFLKGMFVGSAKQGLKQSEKAAVGVILYQAEDVVVPAFLKIVDHWDEYASVKERFNELIRLIKLNLGSISDRIATIKAAALSGLDAGIVSGVMNTIINAFVTTSANIAKVLNDTLVSLIQASKILFATNDDMVTSQEKTKQAIKIVTTALIASVGLVLGDTLGKEIAANIPVLAPISDLVGNVISAIISGGLSAMLIFIVDNLGRIFDGVKDQFNTFMIGLTVSPQTIEASYQHAVAKVETLYQELLTDIYQRYAETGRLQALAYDMNLPTADQFVASGTLAEHVGVDERRILKTRSDITNYFNS